jgi:hypothetical protein
MNRNVENAQFPITLLSFSSPRASVTMGRCSTDTGILLLVLASVEGREEDQVAVLTLTSGGLGELHSQQRQHRTALRLEHPRVITLRHQQVH